MSSILTENGRNVIVRGRALDHITVWPTYLMTDTELFNLSVQLMVPVKIGSVPVNSGYISVVTNQTVDIRLLGLQVEATHVIKAGNWECWSRMGTNSFSWRENNVIFCGSNNNKVSALMPFSCRSYTYWLQTKILGDRVLFINPFESCREAATCSHLPSLPNKSFQGLE